MRSSVESAQNACECLPNLPAASKASDGDLQQWREKLLSLHEPTGNDAALFELILQHYKDTERRIRQLVALRPLQRQDPLMVGTELISLGLDLLIRLAKEADMLVLGLDERFRQAGGCLEKVEANDETESSSDSSSSSEHELELLMPAVYRSDKHATNDLPNPKSVKSFSAAEEELARRGHARASTYLEADYRVSLAGIAQPKPEHNFQGGPIGSVLRRKGSSIPRIFTGSFSELEGDIRKLQLHKVTTPESPSIIDEPIVRDFGQTPSLSPCITPSPLLQRREAVVSKDTECQDRVINGEIVSTRRPSNKACAHTLDDTSSGLEAWLKEDPAIKSVAEGVSVKRGSHRHRENTL